MPPEMCEYPERLSIQAKATGGKKLAVTEIVRAIVEISIMERDVDFSGVGSEEELVESQFKERFLQRNKDSMETR